MDFKSYLRGLGVGMAVTTVILVISFNSRNSKPTNLEIVSMAKELGMVETTAFLQNETGSANSAENEIEPESGSLEENEIETESETRQDTEPESESDTMEENEGETKLQTQPETTKESETQAVTEQPAEIYGTEEETDRILGNTSPEYPIPEGSEIKVTLKGANTTYIAADALKAAGVIDDYEDFIRYMILNEYSRKIIDGEYTFIKGMSYEEIAKIICRIK